MQTLMALPGMLIFGTRLALGACPDLLIAGGESAATDCQLEVQVVNPDNAPFFDRRGRVNPRQSCVDGDPSCDADGAADGLCTYQIASCFNCTDPRLPTCTPRPVDSFGTFRSVSHPVEVENAEAMLAAVVALGGVREGPGSNVVTFDPPLTDATCTDLVPFKVPIRQSASGSRRRAMVLRERGIAGARWDADFARLECRPAE